MPRRSKESLSVVTGLPGQRQQPPDRLSAEAVAVWREIVASKPHDWFTADNRHLLEALCGAIVAHRAIAAQLTACSTGGLTSDEALKRYDRLTKLADRLIRVMATVSTKLRLTNQSRYTPAAAGTASKKARGARPWDAA